MAGIYNIPRHPVIRQGGHILFSQWDLYVLFVEYSFIYKSSKIAVDICRLELKPILPANIYSTLEEAQFEPLRNALRDLYKEWL